MLECSKGHLTQIYAAVVSEATGGTLRPIRANLEEITAILDCIMEGGCPVCSGMIV